MIDFAFFSMFTFTFTQGIRLMIYIVEYYCTGRSNGSIPPKLHMLEENAADFVTKWKAGFGMYGEQSEESIHNEFHQLKIMYCQMQPASRRLESMLQEHYRSIHPASKLAKFKNKFCRKREATLQHS